MAGLLADGWRTADNSKAAGASGPAARLLFVAEWLVAGWFVAGELVCCLAGLLAVVLAGWLVFALARWLAG